MARKLTVSKQNRGKLLHIEAPGCIVNIRVHLADAEGREVTSVEILPDLDRFGEDWQIAEEGDSRDTLLPHGKQLKAVNVRVRRMP